ncbi:hypothetical protein [Elioraea rosea]|uniref:hypothetical protein n=1 Tax=Elioraea rosea TaxID=2492390 RepID=UPI001183EDB3|nr:hypothetical protein [Elioraea rosea]
MPITINDFQNTCYDVALANGVQVSEQLYGTNNEHHFVKNGSTFRSHVVASPYPGLRRIEIIAGNDTVFLPYYQDQIASVRLTNAGPDFFITANMSGCALFIGRESPTNHLVVFHANSQIGSDKATMDAHAPSHQSMQALGAIDTLVATAKPNFPAMRLVCSLTKPTYLANVDQLTNSGGNFLGGTTIAGWRTGTTWEFWYQNWGQVNGTGGVRLLKARKFYEGP